MMKAIKEFFRTWTNVDRDDEELKSTLFKYYIENGFERYLHAAANLILSARLPYREFQRITHSSLLASINTTGQSYIIHLLNYEPLIDGISNHGKKYIYEFVRDNASFWNIETSDVDQTVLYRKLIGGREEE